MSFPVSPEAALARWLAHGVTSLTHPVLAWTLQTHFHPLGIEAEFLEAEPFSALESGQAEWWLRRPRWDAARFDRTHAAAPDFAPLFDPADELIVAVDARGIIYPRLGDRGWPAARHTLRASHAAETFLLAAAGLILANDPVAGIYAAGADAAFCGAVHARLREMREG